MDIIKVVDNLSSDMYLRFLSAVETGKWPEGTVVDDAQRQSAMHIVMAYQARILKSDQIMTVGQDGNIVTKTKRELKEQFSTAKVSTSPSADNDIARFSDL